MFRHILVPLDGSPRAEHVLPVAARMAKDSGGVITLFRVVDFTHDMFYQGPGAPYVTQGMIDDAMTSARQYLASARQHRCLEGIGVETQVSWGNPAEAIISQAMEPPIDLIIISSHGYTGVKRWLLGSTAEKVARHALVPVLILRDGAPLHLDSTMEGYARVRALVPLDTSPRSLDALAPAAELVTALSTPGQGELHLVQIVQGQQDGQKEDLLSSANQYLATVSQNIQEGLMTRFGADLHPTFSWSARFAPDIAEGIVFLAEHGEVSSTGQMTTADLIVLTTHGTGGIHLWPTGSVTEHILHLTRLPILVVRPEDSIAKAHQQQKQHTQARA